MELPLFPLHVVLFPGSAIPLHVFEERYRALMDDVLSDDRRFGIVAIRRGYEVGGYAETHRVGTVATVEQITRAADGSMGIVVTGSVRFSINVRLPDEPYPRADVSILEESEGVLGKNDLTVARAATHRYLSVVAKLQGEELVAPPVSEDIVAASFILAASLGLDLGDRQRLLEAADAATRLRLIAELARREASLLEAVGPSVGRPSGSYSPN
jgi:Lon protease-like protein